MRAIRLASATATSMRGSARQHPGQPRVRRAAPHRPADCRHRAGDQQPPEVALPHLRYLAQLRLSAGRILPGNQAQPGREVPAAPEALQRRHERLDRHRAQRADSRHTHQPHRPFIFARPLPQVPLQLRDLLVEVTDLNEQQRAQLPNRARKWRIGIFNRLRQPLHVRRTLRREDAELGEVSPQRVDRLRALVNQQTARAEQHPLQTAVSRVFTATKRIVGREAASQVEGRRAQVRLRHGAATGCPARGCHRPGPTRPGR